MLWFELGTFITAEERKVRRPDGGLHTERTPVEVKARLSIRPERLDHLVRRAVNSKKRRATLQHGAITLTVDKHG